MAKIESESRQLEQKNDDWRDIFARYILRLGNRFSSVRLAGWSAFYDGLRNR